MAENEVNSEKKTMKISIWFILFLIFVIVSVAYILSLHSKIDLLELQVKNAEAALVTANSSSSELKDALRKELDRVIDTYLAERPQEEKPNPIEVTVGTYTSVVSGEEAALSMTLTLSENNMATLVLNNQSGDSTFNGTYSITDNTVAFTSEDGLTTYSFTAVENGLKLVDNDVDLTLSK